MCALLAAPRIRRQKQNSSRFVRSVRGSRDWKIGMKFIFFLALPLYALDRLTKYWVLHSIDPDRPIVVVPNFFHLVNITNTGAAFGSFKNNNAFFIGISCIALLFALVLLLGQSKSGKAASLWWTRDIWRDVSLELLLAR